MTTISLKDEGERLLEDTKLELVLSVFGKSKVGGSYAYDLLVDRDIDIDVWLPPNKELSYELRAEFAATLLRELHQMRGIKMADVYHFPEGSKHLIKGIWFGLTIVSDVSKERWNIDIWLMTHDGVTEVNEELERRLMNLTTEEQGIILDIKREALARGVKEKGVTSVKIYDAVLNHNAQSFDDFTAYLA